MAYKMKWEVIAAFFKAHEVTLLSGPEDYINAKSLLWFECKVCKTPHYTNWDRCKQGINPNFLCPACMPNASPSQQFLVDFFAKRNRKLLSSYVNNKTPLWFECCCGKPHKICWRDYISGNNQELLCSDCMKKRLPHLWEIKNIVESTGAKLLTEECINAHQKLNFICSRSDCDATGTTCWNYIQQKRNIKFLCEKHLLLSRVNPLRVDWGGRNTEIGGDHWYSAVAWFFNLKKNAVYGNSLMKHETFSSHHLGSYEDFPLLRSSITNGFPILKVFHSDCASEAFKLIHSKQWQNPESWNTDEFRNKFPSYYDQLKLPFHIYPRFQFYDLTKYLVTETIIPSTDLGEIHKHESYWHNRGVIYIPVSWETIAYKHDRDIFFAQIRDELRQFIPEIDIYTGVGYKVAK